MATQKIETGLIADSAVTTAKLADNSVTAAKIAAGSLDDQVKGISSSADAVAITIDSSENVGIGTDSPSQKLHVATSSGDSIILVDNGTSQARFATDNDGPYIYALTSGDSALRVFGESSERMRIDSSGNVGIGTSSPSAKLEIKGASSTNYLQFNNSSDSELFRIDSNFNWAWGTTSPSQAFDMRDTSGNALFAVDRSNGRVGIGTDNPTQKLHVSGNVTIDTDTNSKFTIGDGGADAITLYGGTGDELYIGANNAYKLRFKTDGNIVMDNGGSLGIGTDSPSTPLHVYSNTSGVIATISGPNSYNSETGISLAVGRAKISGVLNGSGGTPGSSLRFYTMPNSGSVTERMSIDSAGSTTFTTGTNDGVKITGAENGAYIDSSKIADVNTKGTFIGLARPEDGNVTVHGIGTYDNTGNTKNNLAITSRSDIVFAGNDGEMGRFLGTGGLTFNGDTAAANALDDYEEGTWTPVVKISTSTTGITGNFGGTYTKVGREVTVVCYINFTNKGSTTGNLLIDNLPFNSGNLGMRFHGSVGYYNLTLSSGDHPRARLTPQSSGFDIQRNHEISPVSNTNLANNTEFYVTLTYFTD
jgi:hypothetical protein